MILKLKNKFHQHKSPISIYYVIIDRIVASGKVPFNKKGFKYLIEHENGDEKVMPLCIMLPKINVVRRYFDETKYIFFDKRHHIARKI